MSNLVFGSTQKTLDQTMTLVNDLAYELKQGDKTKYFEDTLEELIGQVTIALSKNEFFTKWGRHYLISLSRAHQNEFCNNFKDPAIQHYGGPLFKTHRDGLEKVFFDTEPPKPSLENRNKKTQNKTSHEIISRYYDCSNGCWDGDSEILMSDGSIKKAKNVVKGDEVKGAENTTSIVLCVTKLSPADGKMNLIQLEGGLKITQWHPIRVNGQFYFPNHFSREQEIQCEAVYDLVLDKGHTVFVNGVECVTLGHNFTGDVAGHDFFGTDKVIESLQKMNGWEDGSIDLSQATFVREEKTQRVIGIVA